MAIRVVFSQQVDGDPVETVDYGQAAVNRICDLSGRQIGGYILRTACRDGLRRNGRESAYVQSARGSEWRDRYGSQGFHVRVIRTTES